MLDLTPEIPPEDCNAAALVITNRYYFVMGGRVRNAGDHSWNNPLGVHVGQRWNIRARDLDGDVPETRPCHLPDVIEAIRKVAPKAEILVASAFGPFEDQRCSKFSTLTRYPNWSEYPLYEELTRLLKAAGMETRVHITLDVNAAALGEHYYSLLGKHVAQNRKHWRTQHALKRTAYIKVSHGVNLGIVSAGWITSDHSPQMSVVRPQKQIARLARDGIDFIDTFGGICPMHGDCVEGLICVDALRARSGIDNFYSIPRDSDVWVVAAFYIAELALWTTAMITPVRISLGGRLFRIPDDDSRKGEAKPEFVQLVRDFFRRGLYEGRNVPSPRYGSVLNLEEYIGYRTCQYPGLFGGLIIARSILKKTRPHGISRGL